MSIYGRWGDQVTILRLATVEDVYRSEGRGSDLADRVAVSQDAYLLVRHDDDGSESVTARCYLRADGGGAEIDAELAKVGGK